MSQNKNILNTVSERLAEGAEQIGIYWMGAAVLLSLAQTPDNPKRMAIVPRVATFAPTLADNNNPLRREREETAPHFISYSETQRTPARSGKQ